MDVIEELKILGKFTKKIFSFFFFGGGVGGVGLLGWGQGGCERRIEVFVKNQQKKKLGGGWVRGGGAGLGGGVGLVGGQGGCE